MANLVTLIRFLLLFALVALAYLAPPAWQLVNAPLVILIIVLDAVDGYLARSRGETSSFGSVFDIAVDRVVESVLWIVFADLDLVPVWVPIVFITRGVIVDSIRAHQIASRGETPFGMMQTPWGKFLVSGRFMRGFYGVLKATTFGWVLLMQPIPALAPAFLAEWGAALSGMTAALVGSSVFVCIIRGVPVVLEAVLAEVMPAPDEALSKRRKTA